MNHAELSERLWRFAARVGKVVATAKGKSRPRRGEASGDTRN